MRCDFNAYNLLNPEKGIILYFTIVQLNTHFVMAGNTLCRKTTHSANNIYKNVAI